MLAMLGMTWLDLTTDQRLGVIGGLFVGVLLLIGLDIHRREP